MFVELPYRLATDQHLAAGWVNNAAQKREQGGFATARGSDNQGQFATKQLKISRIQSGNELIAGFVFLISTP